MLKSIINQSVLKIFNYFLSILILSIISKNFGIEVLSEYFICLHFLLALSGVCIFGFSLTSQIHIPKSNKYEYYNFIENSFYLLVSLCFIVVAVLMLIFFFKNNPFFIFNNLNNFQYLILSIPLYAILYFFIEILRGRGQLIISQTIILIMYPIIFLLILGYIVYKESIIDISYFYLIFFLTNLFLSSLLIFDFLLNKRIVLQNRINFRKIFYLFKNQFLFFINSHLVLMSIYMYTFIFKFHDYIQEISYFNISIMIASLVGLPLIFLNNKYTRVFSINMDLKTNNLNIILFKNISKISFIFGILISFLLLVFLFFFSNKLFNINLDRIYFALIIIMISFCINNYFGPNQVFLSINNKLKVISLAILFSLSISFLFGIFFIKFYGIIAAAIAFLLYQLIINIILSIYIYKNFYFNPFLLWSLK